jgi:hypothetical protein
MSDNIRIWVEISHQPAFRAGGWAFVRAEGRVLTGAAGGDRLASPDAVALAGLLAALADLPAKAPVEVLSSARPVAGAACRLAEIQAGGEALPEELALWAQLSVMLAARPAHFTVAAAQPRTPTAFAAAWAELARDKAKTRPFKAAIPKVNLAKAGVPA